MRAYTYRYAYLIMRYYGIYVYIYIFVSASASWCLGCFLLIIAIVSDSLYTYIFELLVAHSSISPC